MYRIAAFVLVCAPLVAAAQSAEIQAVAQQAARLSSGTNHDSTSRPKRTVVTDAAKAAVATTVYSGAFTASFTFGLKTAVPSGGGVYCGLSAFIEDENMTAFSIDNEIEEEAGVQATVNGTTATCTVKIPYYWYLADASTDKVQLSYSLAIYGPASTVASGLVRSTSQFVPNAGSIPVPQNGVDTVFSVKAIL